MSTNRYRAIELATNRPVSPPPADRKISEYFAENVFTATQMQRYMSSNVYKQLDKYIKQGKRITQDLADAVAAAMKGWAIEKGATHYTHWFQPLTHATAEKHDAFFEPDKDNVIEKFKGASLVQQEPDASSFPSGGLRNTFEARGYTAWDPSSPAFIFDLAGGKVLCIPTVFVSYTGESLDHKFPLLKAIHALDKAATEVAHYFDPKITKVNATLGVEQEYFVLDRALYFARPDLVMSGRTLFGASPAKHQQLSDHYFGSISPRIRRFMKDFEIEALRLGIPITTRHNEVAPSQFECAPMFEDVNLACDHNQMLMDLMDIVAERHNLKVILHEKPFATINGTGKHNNWSMSTAGGKNLLSPGSVPSQNLLFMTFFINVIKAMHEHGDIVRAAIASAGNDHRLGANEAPPAIISVFIGSQLTAVLDAFENNEEFDHGGEELYVKLGLDKIPEILKDNTDRNRTSPFAFTGNKFELRAVGGAASCSLPMMALNSIVADQLTSFKKEVDELIEKDNLDKEVALVKVLRRLVTESRPILFEGDGYSEEWVKEAEKRGLPNLRNTPDALASFVSEKGKGVFSRQNVLTEDELEARNEVYLEQYCITIGIEAHLYDELSHTYILPAAYKYQAKLAESVEAMKDIDLDEEVETQIEIIKAISNNCKLLRNAIVETRGYINEALAEAEMTKQAMLMCNKVKPMFDIIRKHADALEIIVDDAEWPMLKYRELLFMR